MPDKQYTNNLIDPNRWYSETDLLLILGVSVVTQKQARDAGKLKYVQPEGSVSALYRGEWVLAWLDAEPVQSGPDRQPQRIGGAGRRLTVPASITPLEPVQERTLSPMAQKTKHNPIDRWHAAVKAKMDGGMSKRKAVLAVAREDPELHRKFLILTNARMGNHGGARQLLDLSG